MLQQRSTGLANAQSRAREVPEVSVIMPVYNTRQEWLDTAIGSILGQTYSDFELIVIDNGSDEDTRRLLVKYEDPRIVPLRFEKNVGAAIARNEGLKIARGQYIAFMDSDDISLPERLEKQVEYMGSHPNIGLVGTRVGDAVHPRRTECLRGENCSRQIECDLLLVGNVLCISSVMVRREVIRQSGICFRDDYFPAEDYKMWLDLLGRTEFGKMDEVLVRYRRKKNNTRSGKQKVLACRAQAEILTRQFGAKEEDAETLVSFLHARQSSYDQQRLLGAVNRIAEQLEVAGYAKGNIQAALRRAVRRVFYRTRTWRGQRQLLRLPLNEMLQLGLLWRLWCLVTRGIL